MWSNHQRERRLVPTGRVIALWALVAALAVPAIAQVTTTVHGTV
jgi:hypothetical protein